MSEVAKTRSSREIALARRKALSSVGKAALQGSRARPDKVAAPARGAVDRPAPVRASSASTPIAGSSARVASRMRRKALSARGKLADTSQDRTRSGDRKAQRLSAEKPSSRADADAAVAASAGKTEGGSCSCGCKNRKEARDAAGSAVGKAKRNGRTPLRRPRVDSSTAKVAALARRKALSKRGKAALSSGAMSEAQAVRASNPKMTSRELAKAMREARSRRGNAGRKKSTPCGRRRKSAASEAGVGPAQDAPWKVGASETASGQVVTGTMVGRKANMTGDEPSTCRGITGTEYLGADIFREFCQTDVSPSTIRKVVATTTSHGNTVSGNRLGRASNVTGNEPGTCKLVTGDEYISAEQVQGYCGEFAQKSPRKISMAETMKGKAVTGDNVGRSEKVTGDEYGMRQSLTGTQYTKPSDIGAAPAKVGVSGTLRGGHVTGTLVGRRERMTGDEAGSCRHITGDDYVGKEQYSDFCEQLPQPTDQKVGTTETFAGQSVTGSLTARSASVTGDEPGTCKVVTGTPYTGAGQYQEYCEPEQAAEAQARMQPARRNWGKAMTGLQPGVQGLTGAEKGACETVSGTPFVGADQVAEACPAMAAEPDSPDFPQALGQAPWADFSVTSPAQAAAEQRQAATQVTGSQYERGGQITGSFGKAEGKVTGTEQARFDRPMAAGRKLPDTAETIAGRAKTRISGEGMEAKHITGDDWDRGDHVTGTEGLSAVRRNPTIRSGKMSAMPSAMMSRPEDVPEPVSRVTGSSGNSVSGSLVTYSGGARG